jgi:dolichyl-diphosphooligosaccharide--protein glycosyltransferase
MTYGFVFFLGLAGLVFTFKYRVDLPFVIWSIVIILATIGQRRWGYYSAINISLLAAFLLVVLSKYLEKSWRSWLLGVTVIALLLSVLPGSISMLKARPYMTEDWEKTLVWMRENTPEPFNSDYYTTMGTEEKPTYAVMSWWDYGHWIIRDARRVPMSSPTQQETRMAYMFFIAQTPEEADEALEGYNVRYIIIDSAMVFDKFYAMVLKSGQTSITLDYFYNSMVYRLFADDQIEGYKEVFDTTTVKVFERVRG